jgi:hypothetical protein
VVSPNTAQSEAALHRRAIEKVAPPSMLVDELPQVLRVSENAGRNVQPSGGPLSGDVIDLVRPELRLHRPELAIEITTRGALMPASVQVTMRRSRVIPRVVACKTIRGERQ